MKDRGRGTCKNKALNEDNRCKWNKATLTHILTRQEYCGDVVNFKTTKHFDCEFFAGEQEQLGTSVVADLRTGNGAFVVVFGKGLSVVHLGQLLKGIVDEQPFCSDLRQTSIDKLFADCGVFRIIFIIGGDGAFRI